MLVLEINKILEWCRITTGGRRYTCPIKLIDNELHWHRQVLRVSQIRFVKFVALYLVEHYCFVSHRYFAD